MSVPFRSSFVSGCVAMRLALLSQSYSFECVKLHNSVVMRCFYESKKADKFSTGVNSVRSFGFNAHIKQGVCSFCDVKVLVCRFLWLYVTFSLSM